MNIKPVKTRTFKEGENLSSFIARYIKKVPERSVLVISSKVVALAEGRTAPLSQRAALIKSESDPRFKVNDPWFTVKDGMVMAAAGIDESNADGKLILLPKDSYSSAVVLRKALQKNYKVKYLGVVIADSSFMPMRSGALAAAVGYAGFKGLRDYRGKKDIFGRKLKVSWTNVADSLATAATLVMGEGDERQPLALITDAPVQFVEKVNKKELRMPPKGDMYAKLIRSRK